MTTSIWLQWPDLKIEIHSGIIEPSSWISRRKPYFNVRDYGAVGDGITDDSAAIAAARSACVAAGGGKIYFPSGEYLTS